MAYARVSTRSTDPTVSLKIPQEMYDEIDQAAKCYGHSFDLEFILTLQKAFRHIESDGFSANEWLEMIFMPAQTK